MKYLITAIPGPTQMPSEHGVALLQAGLAWIKSKLADGSLDCTYNYFGGGGIAIGNADSHEQILADLLEYPLYPFFEWDVTPLLDLDTTLEQYVGFYQRIASQ